LDTDAKTKLIRLIGPSLQDGSFIKMTFGKYRGGDSEFKGLSVTLITTNDGDKLSFRFAYKTREVVKNFDPEAGISLISEITGKEFLSASLFTSEKDYSLDYSKKHVPMLHIRQPSFKKPAGRSHNREKQRIVDSNSKYFNLLGITSADGKIHSDKYDKFRQVDKFIQVVDTLISSAELDQKDTITATDLGSGKSYMTFALYDYLVNTRQMNAAVRGIEQRTELAELSNRIAKQCSYEHLFFTAAKISEKDSGTADVVTALHACDTATDDAIVFALNSGAAVIVLAPCCQKYLRHRMKVPGDLKPLFKHGIHEERLAVMLTDSLRALVLEYFGYETKVFEFISTEHTSRNTMITGIKKHGAQVRQEKFLKDILDTKQRFGLNDFYLDAALKIGA
jgi:hypothetical protein